MTATDLVKILIESDLPVDVVGLIEASVHVPHRGRLWIAYFRDRTGRPISRKTGESDRQKALALARKWEAEEARLRQASPAVPKKPTIRVRTGSAEASLGLFSQEEVAVIMKISIRAVRETERRAFDKLRRNPALQRFWKEWKKGQVGEALGGSSEWELSRSEVAAVLALAKTPFERRALLKLLRLASTPLA